IIEEPGAVYINDTRRTVVREYDLRTGRQVRAINIRKMSFINTLVFRSVLRALKEKGIAFFGRQRKATARPLYLRGLAINEGSIFAGFSPATIVRIDKVSGQLVDYYIHSTDMRDCIHGLCCE
ncbi:MAG: hypothetical protein WBS20_10630, partial [Lysobacterales bacterium]